MELVTVGDNESVAQARRERRAVEAVLGQLFEDPGKIREAKRAIRKLSERLFGEREVPLGLLNQVLYWLPVRLRFAGTGRSIAAADFDRLLVNPSSVGFVREALDVIGCYSNEVHGLLLGARHHGYWVLMDDQEYGGGRENVVLIRSHKLCLVPLSSLCGWARTMIPK